MNYTIEKKEWKNKVGILRLQGQLDRAFHPAMDDSIQAVIDSGYRNFAVDLADLEYMSSSGIAALVNLRGKLERVTGDLCFFAPNGRVNKVLDVMGMKRAYTFYEDEAAAEAGFLSDA